MSMFYCSLNSGSNGNCYWVGTAENAVLIDLGLSCKELEKRLLALELNPAAVKALFVTHEHIDHIKGVAAFARRYKVPVYGNHATLKASNLFWENELCCIIEENAPIEIGDLTVQPFSKHHDAADPISFTVEHKNARIAVITDIGHACAAVKNHFSSCHVAILEANYDEQMLMNGPYPAHLKRRISGKKGHLSNAAALQLYQEFATSDFQHLILGHLSQENNDVEMLKALFTPHCKKIRLDIASRFEAGPVFELKIPLGLSAVKKNKAVPHLQLSLF